MARGVFWLSIAGLLLTACTSCSSSSSKSTNGGSTGDGGMSSSSSGGNGDSGSGSGPTAAQACQDYAHAACTQLSACAPFTLSVTYGDESTCEQRLVLACTPIFGANGATATPATVDMCAQAVTGETCDQVLDNDQPSACAFAGSLTAGAACGLDAQCASGFCRHALASVCGTCATRAGAGQAGPDGGVACAVDNDCMATLVCGAGTCVSPAAAGAACSMQQPCERTLACVSGKCATPVPVGGACTMATDCDGTHGAYCDTAKTKTCVAYGAAASTQPCGLVGSTITLCTAAGTCDNVTKGQGTCHQPVADGAPCGPDLGCMAPSVCTSQAKCTLPDPSTCH